MFTEIDTDYMNAKPAQLKSDKNIIISFSLLMRLMEWCKEDAKDDVELHKVMEKLIAFNDGINPLTIDVYDCLIDNIKLDKEDTDLAYELGVEKAEENCDLNSDGRNYSMVAGEIITDEKDNGYGASNDELEAFWDGYREIEPLKTGCFTEYDMTDDVEVVKKTYEDGKQWQPHYSFEPQANVIEPEFLPYKDEKLAQSTIVTFDDENKPFKQTVGLDDEIESQIEELINLCRN